MRSLISSTLRSLLTRRPANRTVRKARPTCRLELDVLGDRLTPALLSVTNPQSVFEGDSGTTDRTFIISSTSATNISVDYSLDVRQLSPGTPSTGRVIIPAHGTVPITIQVQGDTVPEDDSDVVLAVRSTYFVGGVGSIETAYGKCHIFDDDATVSVAGSTQNENAGTIDFQVKLSKPITNPNKPVTLYYQTRDYTAKSGTDYVGKLGAVTVAAGNTVGITSIQLKDDTRYTGTRAFYLDYTGTSPGISIQGTPTVIGTILDNESPPVPPIGNPPDTQAPTTPGNLQASNITTSGVTLSWQASTDNVGVAGYAVYSLQSNGTFSPIATTTSTSYTVSGLAASTKYSFYVVARDAAANVSSLSNTTTITTQVPAIEAVLFGGSDQVPVGKCDFDGDGKTDLATYQTTTGIWSIKESSTGRVYGVQWGGSDQVPVGGCDFDGDGKTDLAAYRKSDGMWSLRYSRTGLGQPIQWGGSDQVPVGGCDFDGDHKTDLVAYQPSTATWSIRYSSSGLGQAIRFGGSDQVPVGGCDFDGDHRTDLATYQTGTGIWSIKDWSTGRVYGVQWGGADQVAVGGCDLDGDHKTDLVAYRTTDGMCSIKYSSTGLGQAIQWGGSNQVSVGGCDFDGDGKTDLVAYRTTDGMWSIRHR